MLVYYLVCEGDKDGEEVEVRKKVVLLLYVSIRQAAEAVAKIQQPWHAQHEVVTVCLDKIVAGDGSGVDVMFTEWTNEVLK